MLWSRFAHVPFRERERERKDSPFYEEGEGGLHGVPGVVKGDVFGQRRIGFVKSAYCGKPLSKGFDAHTVYETGCARKAELAGDSPPEGVIGNISVTSDAGEIVEVFETRRVGPTSDLGAVGRKRAEVGPHFLACDTLQRVGLHSEPVT